MLGDCFEEYLLPLEKELLPVKVVDIFKNNTMWRRPSSEKMLL